MLVGRIAFALETARDAAYEVLATADALNIEAAASADSRSGRELGDAGLSAGGEHALSGGERYQHGNSCRDSHCGDHGEVVDCREGWGGGVDFREEEAIGVSFNQETD